MFNETAITRITVIEQDEHGWIRETDRTDDPFIFMYHVSSSQSTHNFGGVFKGSYPINMTNVTYAFVVSDEDPLDAYMSDGDLPGTVLPVHNSSTCIPSGPKHDKATMLALFTYTNLSDDLKNSLKNMLMFKDNTVDLKIWLIVKTQNIYPATIRQKQGWPAVSYCEFLFTKDHINSFAPMYRYEAVYD